MNELIRTVSSPSSPGMKRTKDVILYVFQNCFLKEIVISMDTGKDRAKTSTI